MHCDIKPDNMLLDSDGHGDTFALADFGLAAGPKAGDTCAGRGTPGYMAPELPGECDGAFGDHHTAEKYKADIWSMTYSLYVVGRGNYVPVGNCHEKAQKCFGCDPDGWLNCLWRRFSE